MDKNPRDVINKASQTLLESAKDAASINIVTACRTKQLKIEAAEVQKLLLLVGASVEEGFNRGRRAFSKTLDEQLAATSLKAALPSLLDRPKKK